MINRAVIIGRLTKDPELKTTNNGISVLQFTVAVSRPFTNANGERDADFINCVAWRKNAENISKYFNKGRLIGLDGRIQTRTYKDNDNRTVYVTEIVVDSWSFMGAKKDQQQQQNQSNWQNPATNIENKPANAENTKQVDPFKSQDTIDISDDDLPF